MSKRVIGLDIETYDPLLKTAGYSWKYEQGFVLNTALYYEDKDKVAVIAGIHNDNSPYDKQTREEDNRMCVEMLLQNPDVCIVGANLQYDIGWLLYEYGMSTYDVKCSFVDVLQAEHILNEFSMDSLETLSRKYLKYGKTKDRIEDWVKENISKKGDFRQYLKDAPWELLCEYVTGDAKNPVKIWRKQLTLLKQQDLCKRAKLEFDCLLPTLQMTMYGMPVDMEQKQKNLDFLGKTIAGLHDSFVKQYDVPSFRVTASRDIASLCDKRNIPYKYKMTLVGFNGERFKNGEETDEAYNRAKRLVSQFRLAKGVPVAYVPKEMAERTRELLEEEGFMLNSSPNVDKKFFESKQKTFPEIDLIANWKLAKGIESKILGEKYDRFICKNFKGENVIKSQFKITDTISFRYSASQPNCIAEDTLLLTPQGYKPLYCLKEGDSVYNGNGDLTVIKHIWYKGKRNCLSLVSANGAELVCTPEHKQWNGKDWVKAEELNETDIIEKRTDCLSLSENADNTSNSGSIESLSRNCRKGVERRTLGRREKITENSAQGAYGTGIYRPSLCEKVCRRIYFRSTTSFQRFMYQVQGFIEQRKKFSKEISYKRADNGATQSESSTGKIQVKRCFWKASHKLQGRVFRQEGVYNSGYKRPRVSEEKFHTQSSDGSSTRDFSRNSAKGTGSTSHRPQPLKQRLGQLGSMYTICSYKVTSTTCGLRRVYDLEVESEDHSFIANGFRTKNCQQVPSKGGFSFVDSSGKKTDVSFPKITRALFTRSKGCVFGKIDYGQIEYRLICNIACGESGKEVRRQYAENPHLDFHQYVVDLTGLSRKYAKNMSFGVSFGMGLPSMAETFGWTMEKAEEISEAYHSKMPFVAPTLALVGDIAKERGYIRTVYGSHARLPDKKKSYTMLNRYTQGSGAECLKVSIVQAYKEGLWEKLKPANTVHDELNFPYLEPTEECMVNFYRMAEIMRTSMPELKVPLEAEIELGDNWASTKTIPEWVAIRDAGWKEIDSDGKVTDWSGISPELRTSINICEKLVKENKVRVG